MYYILMNKDTQVAYCKDNKIIKLIRDDMLPIGSTKLKKGYDISFWLNKRQIPTTRSNYIKIAQSLKSENIDINEFTEKATFEERIILLKVYADHYVAGADYKGNTAPYILDYECDYYNVLNGNIEWRD